MASLPLALCPGLLCNHQLWEQQIEALAGQADCFVARFDQHNSMDAMAMAVLEEMPQQFALAGLSMGGYVAQAGMRLAPERVTHLA